ncbi:MAG: hypothetical protein ACO3QC_01210 [Phycisphaerales bacterium]|jgi:putative hemolysin
MELSLSIDKTRMDRQVAEARRMFNRVLVCWAGDVLELRRQGLLAPTWKFTPSLSEHQAPTAFLPMNPSARKAA